MHCFMYFTMSEYKMRLVTCGNYISFVRKNSQCRVAIASYQRWMTFLHVKCVTQAVDLAIGFFSHAQTEKKICLYDFKTENFTAAQ